MEPVGIEPTSEQPFQRVLLHAATFTHSTKLKRTNSLAISQI